MKRTLNLILAAAMSVALFSGCNDENVSKYIPDNSTVDSTTDSTADGNSSTGSTPIKTTKALDTVVTDYKFDFWSNEFDGYVMTDKYLYFDDLFTADGAGGHVCQDYKIDLQTGEMTSLCNVPQCHHSFKDTDCESFIPLAAIGDKCYALKRTGIFESRTIIDESGNVVFENKFASDFALQRAEQRMDEYDSEGTKYDEDDVKYAINYILADEKNLYIVGYNYIYAYDIETKQNTEPLIIDEDFWCDLLGADMENKRVYFKNDVQEVFMADLANQTVTKVCDGNINNLIAYNGKIYYICFLPHEPDEPWRTQLFEAAPDFTNAKVLIEDCENVFNIKDDKIFYFDQSTDEGEQQKMLHSYDISTGESTDLFDVAEDVMRIVTAPHIDRIFTISLHSEHTGVSYVQNTVLISFKPDGSDVWTNEVKNQEGLY